MPQLLTDSFTDCFRIVVSSPLSSLTDRILSNTLQPEQNARSMQKVKVRGQKSRSQRSKPNLTVSGL